MKALAASAFSIVLTGGLAFEVQAEDQSRHFDFGIFTLNVGEAADLTSEHIPLKFIKVWPHPFGNRAINLSVGGRSYTVGVGTSIDLKSPYLRPNADKAESVLSGKDRCSLDITDFEIPKEGDPKVMFALDCM